MARTCGLALALCTACASGRSRLDIALLAQTPLPADPYVTATWLGTAGLLLDDGTTALLLDPFVSRPSLARVAFARPLPVDEARIDQWMKMPGVERTAAVLVSHSHYDHLMDAPSFARRTGATLVGSASTSAVGRSVGLPDSQVQTAALGTPMHFGDFAVTMLPSQHGAVLLGRVPYAGTIDAHFSPPAKAKDYRMGGAFTVVVEHPSGTLLHHASAAWLPGVLDGVHADVVFLGLAGRADTGEYLDAVVDKTGAHAVVPIHWDNFFRSFDLPLRALRSAHVGEFFDHVTDTRPDLQIHALPLGHARTVLPRP